MSAIDDVIAERERQKASEGWTEEHDDQHKNGELSKAAACYATGLSIFDVCGNELWPWERRWDKRNRHDRRRQLVIAGALILAEIERLDRQAAVDAFSHKPADAMRGGG